MGREYRQGWWPYFPVLIFFKSPLPWLLFAAWGLGLMVVRRSRSGLGVAALALAIVLVASTSTINIGARHVLPLFTLVSMVAGFAVIELWRTTREIFGRVVYAGLLAWLLLGVAAGHPDYLPWFNELAGTEPSHITVDSNLDWGQDLLRLAREVRRRNIAELHTALFASVRYGDHGINAIGLQPHTPTRGWVAAGEHVLRFAEDSGEYDWLRNYRPVAMVGKSIRLYYIPEAP